MATADELLSTIDTDKTLIIDKDLRTIIIPSSVKNLGVESDDDVLRLKFSMPRMYGDVDLSDFSIYINYMNAKNTGDVYVVDDKTIADDTITFSWLVGRVALAYKGNVRFIVCMKKHDDDSNVIQEYNTTIASLPVLEGLETGETVIQQNPDIIEMLLTSSEPLVGTTQTITPSQVLVAIKAGRDIALRYTDSYYGSFVFSAFNANEKLGIVVSNSILPQMDGLTGTLLGFVEDDAWIFKATNTATKDDVGTAVGEALAAAKASGEFDGADGITPTIGDNGNWYLGSTDTGKPSRGEKGDTGATGATGAIGPQGPKGDTGETGPAGIGVPDGGKEGQLLGKTSDGPAWVDMPESGLPTGGAPYQQLVTDGTGTATWEDRTHWVEQRAAELIPEQTLSGGMSMGTAYMFNVSYFTIIPNLEYTVVFDGVEYKCISAELGGSTYIGNATLLGVSVEDTGEPFFIAPIEGMSVITATDGPHTIALSGWNIVYHQLPLDYIPNGKFLNGFIEHSSLTMTRDEASRYGRILSKSLFPMLVWQDFPIKRISVGTSHGVNVIYITDYDGASYTITENSDGLYSVDDANNGDNYLYIKKGTPSKSRLLLKGGKPVSIEGVQVSTENALDYTTFCVKKTGRKNCQDFEVLGNGAVKAYSVILPSSTAGSTKKFKITVDDSGTISATEVV